MIPPEMIPPEMIPPHVKHELLFGFVIGRFLCGQIPFDVRMNITAKNYSTLSMVNVDPIKFSNYRIFEALDKHVQATEK
jgi:hypothetical protein